METTQLIAACLRGNAQAVEELISVYQQDLYRLAFLVLDDAHEAEDALQEVFISALSALDSYERGAAFSTWLYAITLNHCRSRLRKRKTRERLLGILQSLFHLDNREGEHPEKQVISHEKDAQLWRGIQSLDEKHRLPLLLHYYRDLPTAQIAEVLGISEGTVYSRLYTARERLRVMLQELHGFKEE